MTAMFFIASGIALVATVRVVTSFDAFHALLYLVVSLLAVSVDFFLLGAPMAAALEVIVYAGAIMVLFVFVIMLLNLGSTAAEQERKWLGPGLWKGPALLAAVLLIDLMGAIYRDSGRAGVTVVSPKALGLALYGPYLVVVELASMLLLAGLVGAYHLGRKEDAP